MSLLKNIVQKLVIPISHHLQQSQSHSVVRSIASSSHMWQTPSTPTPPPPPSPASSSTGSSPVDDPGRAAYKPNDFEKRLLVWAGKYKTTDEIPTRVNPGVMEHCRNRMRIRIANIMMAATLLGCLVMVWSGKKAADEGKTVVQMNLDWHKAYNEQQDAAKNSPVK